MSKATYEPPTALEASQVHALKQRVRHRSTGDGKSTYFGKYVSQEGSEKLLTYEYHGADNSLIYKHVLTPMNNFLVELLPLWLAPNLITLIGLVLVGGTHTLFVFLCPLLEGDAPWWAMVVAGAALFGYQTLDNLDGKQARRTKSSSPLGLLFDHGCDALNVSVGTMTMASILQMGTTWRTLGFVLSAHFVFIFATWEEYYSGSLELPIINGPTEGILIGIALKLFTAVVGVDFWKEELIDGVQNNSLFVIVTMISSCFTLLVNVRNALHAVRLNQDSVLVAFTRLLPFLILNTLAGLWALYSPSDIFSTHPRMFLWMLGLLNSKLVLHLMLAHLCGEEYHPFRKTLVPIFYVAGHCAFCMLEGIYEAINEELIVREFFFLSLAAYVHIVITVVWEVKNVLGVSVFTIPSPKPSKPAAKSSLPLTFSGQAIYGKGNMHFVAISPREEFSPPSLAVTQLSSRTLKSGKSIMEWTGPRPQYQFSFPPQSQAWQRYDDDEDEEKQEELPGHSMLEPQRYATNNISPPPRPISAVKTELPSMFGSDGNIGVTLQPQGSLSIPQLEESTEFQPFCLPQNPAFSDLATLPPCIQPPQPNSVDLQRQLYAQLDTQFSSQFPDYAAESTNRYQVPTLFPLKKSGMDNFTESHETVAIDSSSPLPMTSEANTSQFPEYTAELTNRYIVPTLFPLKQSEMSSFTEEERARGDREVAQQRVCGRTQPSPHPQGRVVMPNIQEPKLSPDKRKLCCVEGCKSQARAFNRCKRHGGSKRCSSPGCTKSVQSRGLCIRHGGGSRCQESGCTRASQSQGRCKMHGGGRPCIVVGCDKKAHLKRLCRKHGGGTKCCMVGCDKWAQRQGMCMTHSKEVGMTSNDIGAMTPHLQPISPGSSPPLRFFSDAV